MASNKTDSLKTKFHFDAEMKLMITDIDNMKKRNITEVKIPTPCVKSIVTEYNYDTYNTPLIYVSLKISALLAEQMRVHMDNATIILTIYKYDIKSNVRLNKKYIEEEFIYKMNTDLKYNSILGNMSGATDEEYTGYEHIMIGLIKLGSLNNNKVEINNVFKRTNTSSILHYYTKHMNMIIEPFDNNHIYDQLIVPPLNSVTKLIKYLFDQKPFYNTSYRYFRDFDRTYILSTKGNPVPANDSTYDTVIVHILVDDDMEIDRNQKCYVINVDQSDINTSLDKFTENSYNKIVTVNSVGESTTVNINIDRTMGSTDKTRFVRTNDIRSFKDTVESTSSMVNIVKTEIDSSILTPNKEYQIQSFNSYQKYSGKYLLSYKREILIMQDGEFTNSTIFGLRRVIS